jgi:hypothetical protein
LDEKTPPHLRRVLVSGYGRFASRLHDAGVWQYDFNPTNVLVHPDRPDELTLIDFELAKLCSSISERSRLGTLVKMNRIPRLSKSDRLRFLMGYWGGQREKVRKAVSQMVRFAKRQLQRDIARWVRHCVRENRNFSKIQSEGYHGFYRRFRSSSEEGITAEQALVLAMGTFSGFRIEPSDRALDRWKRANEESRKGGPIPMAVLMEAGSKRGVVVYLGSSSRTGAKQPNR